MARQRHLTFVFGAAVCTAAVGLTAACGREHEAGDQAEPVVELGTAHPGLVEAVAPDGRWAVICQARADTDGDGAISVLLDRSGEPSGDRSVPYLVVEKGPGLELRRYLGADPEGRYVAARTTEGAVVFDTTTGAREPLGSVGADTAEPIDDHVSFDASGRSLLTVRRRGDQARILVRDLVRRRDVELDPGPGLVLRADLSPDGAWVVVWVVDSDGNGVLEAPRRKFPAPRPDPPSCGGAAQATRDDEEGGDDATTRVLAVADGWREGVPGFVCFFRGGWIRATNTSGLVAETRDGSSRELSPSHTYAYFRGADEASGQVLLESQLGGTHLRVVALDGTSRKLLSLHSPVYSHSDLAGPTRFRPLLSSLSVYDWQKRVVIPIGGGLVGSVGSRMLVKRARLIAPTPPDGKWAVDLVIVDADTRKETEVAIGIDSAPYRRRFQAGSLIAVSGVVVDLTSGKVIGRYSSGGGYPFPTEGTATLGLHPDGRLLRSSGPSQPSERHFPMGPFRWVRPE